MGIRRVVPRNYDPKGEVHGTRSSNEEFFLSSKDPERSIQRRTRIYPNSLNNYEEINMDANGNGDDGLPLARGGLPVPDLRTMEELCQPTLNGDDANKHLDKFLHVTQSIKVNGVIDEALCLYLFPHSLTHHATAWDLSIPYYYLLLLKIKWNCETEVTKNTVPPTNSESTKDVQPSVVQIETQVPNSEPVVAPVVEPSLKSRAALNLLPFPVWEKAFSLFFPELTPTCMTLELADRSISRPIGVAEDVFIKVGKFHFPVDFVVVGFDADPRVPLILGRSFLEIERALIDVYAGELTLRVGNKAVTFNLDQTSRYSSNYDDISVNRIDVIDVACEEYSQEVFWIFHESQFPLNFRIDCF
ncbi:reverse transcriptase domain-containing protein [Tanacetum coccineum]|uniref:Reverse transcriptase domain-containing protein n=1 Tax=Tanacetum coccineum TaxID=301880 RepID=A0ABQ4ZDQ2_9ASTR